AAVRRCVELGLPLSGYHCHVGSQLLDPEAQLLGGETIARFAVQMAKLHGVTPLSLNVGGGLGVRYVDEEPMEVEEYCRLVAAGVSRALEGSGLAPTLAHEPGRALVAESGVTLYTVGPIKEVDLGRGAQRVYVSVDGGMSDNPRPALYDAAYTVLPLAAGDGPTRKVTVCGRHCEADTMFRDVELPVDLKPGDLLQVLCTGAYASSMASNYNRFPRPATVLIRPDGKPEIVQERETWDQVLAREPIPEDLRT
ncbi:MAG: diaminopimelate decarboxylase, partial [Fimbriimonas ginsengisoli]|nr:diaminopimelate decarboxylase [Fimbriimonas ginsengisoli]